MYVSHPDSKRQIHGSNCLARSGKRTSMRRLQTFHAKAIEKAAPRKLQQTHPGQSLEHANYERNPFQKPVGKSCLGCVPVRCHWFTTLNIDLFCSRCQFESGSGSCWAPLCPRGSSSTVSSAEIAVGQYVLSQWQYV